MKRQLLSMIALGTVYLGTTVMTGADEIVVDGTHYRDVYIRTTESTYYIQTPTDGKVFSTPRNQVDESTVKITADTSTRAQLLGLWKSNNPRHQELARVSAQMKSIEAKAASSEAEGRFSAPTLTLRGTPARRDPNVDALRSNGYVPYINMKDVPLGTALDGILRPMGLDYKIYGNVVFVSTPAILRNESWDPIQTRQFQYHGNDTLHKIVLRNPAGVRGASPRAGGIGAGSLGNNASGVGGQNQGGAQGGFGGQNGGFGGQGGGGQNGGFGGQGGGGGDVTSISNISQLFSNIDDRIVGEAPAIIGGNGYYFQD